MPGVITLEVVFDQDFEPNEFAQKEAVKDVGDLLVGKFGWGRSLVAEVAPGPSQADMRDWLKRAHEAIDLDDGSNDDEHDCLLEIMGVVHESIREPDQEG